MYTSVSKSRSLSSLGIIGDASWWRILELLLDMESLSSHSFLEFKSTGVQTVSRAVPLFSESVLFLPPRIRCSRTRLSSEL